MAVLYGLMIPSLPDETEIKQVEELLALDYLDPDSDAEFDQSLACRLMNHYSKLLFTLGKQ